MREDEGRRYEEEEPEDELESLFDFDEDDPFGEEEEEEPAPEEMEAQLRRLFGEPPHEIEEARQFDKGRELQVRVMGVYERTEAGQPSALLVHLQDNYGRNVPIVIGPFEAHAIARALHEETLQRPLTHDLIRNILVKLGVSVDRVVIDDLWEGTYYAKIFLVRGEEEIEIDARPSDAIAIALRFRAPIYMVESVLNEAATDEFG